jgi:hypothetical protein
MCDASLYDYDCPKLVITTVLILTNLHLKFFFEIFYYSIYHFNNVELTHI